MLLTAYRQGYFEVSRRPTLSDLADTVEISDSALSQRIRQGTDALVEQTLSTDDRRTE